MRLPKWLRWRSDEELNEELQAHLEDAEQLNLDRGMSPEEARYAARRAVGNPTQIKERVREADPIFKLELIAKDLQYAWRGLRRNPGFTFAAVISLALGIGANTAIFSFVDAIMLRPIPVPRPNEIVVALGNTPKTRQEDFSFREYQAYRDQNRTLANIAAERFSSFSLKAADQSVLTYGYYESGNYFDTFEVKPLLGRTFSAVDDSPSAKSIAVVLGHRFWSTTFHADPALVGSTVRLNGQPATVIGILPESFTGTDLQVRPQVYTPLAMLPRLAPSDADILTNPQRRSLNMWGRLKPGVAVESAQADFSAIASALAKSYPESNRDRGIGILREMDSRFEFDPDNAVLLVLLLGLVGLVLLISCTNVANLLLGRATARTREIAIRMSVGASRGRLIGQFLTESFLLAALGMGAGLLLASWATSALAAIPLPIDIPFEFALRLDNRVLVYTAGIMMVSVLLFGLWPALVATKSGLNSAGSAANPSKRRNWGRNTLVVAQTALVAMLLIAAGLFTQAFLRAGKTNPGFRVDNVLLATFDPVLAGYSGARTKEFYTELEQRARNLPGVRSAAIVSHIQLRPVNSNQDVVPAGLDATDVRNRTSTLYNYVTPEFFPTLDTPLIRGRAIDSRDTGNAPPVAVVNETMAHMLWPNADAIGQRIQLLKSQQTAEVVGIARDGKYEDISEAPQPYIYLPFSQHAQSRMTLLLYTAGDPAALTPALRAEVKTFAPDLPINEVQTMRTIFEQMGLLFSRLVAQLTSIMALIGLILGLTGLYAVAAFAVNQRIREFGIRMALGATPRSILQGVLFSGFKVTAVGLALGLAGALGISGYFTSFLSKVDPHDPVTFAGVAILLLAVALAACWVPARRASLVDPAVTLRQE